MRVIVTGSREWPDAQYIYESLSRIYWDSTHAGTGHVVVVHGDCPTGVDSFARKWCSEYPRAEIREERHPADWVHFGRGAGLFRNQAMVDLGADRLIAFPYGKANGTCHCIAAAIRAEMGVEVIEHPNDPWVGYALRGSRRWEKVNEYIRRGPSYPNGQPMPHMF